MYNYIQGWLFEKFLEFICCKIDDQGVAMKTKDTYSQGAAARSETQWH